MEDIFTGTSSTWPSKKERIEEYKQLAFLREGGLEIIYYSTFWFVDAILYQRCR